MLRLGLLLVVFVSVGGDKCHISENKSLRTHNTSPSVEISISLKNSGGADLTTYWVDTKGTEVQFGDLYAGSTVLFNTFNGHAWRIRSEIGTVFEMKVAAENGQQQTFEVGKYCEEINDFNDLDEDDSVPRKKIEPILSDDYNEIDSWDKMAKFKVGSSFETIRIPLSDQQFAKQISKSSCKDSLNEWISRVIIVPGYHILCIEKKSIPDTPAKYALEIDAWIDGQQHISSSSRQSFIGQSFSEFREYLEQLLEIKRTDAWFTRTKSRQEQRRTGPNPPKMKEFMPQPWRVFDHSGDVITSLTPITSTAAPMIALVFEGGQFIYPGIDVGYQRQIRAQDRDIILETLSVRPLVLGVSNLLSESEYSHIIKTSTPHMAQSEVSFMDKDKGKADTEFRTSTTYFMPSKNDKFLPNIDKRVANLTKVPITHQEFVQVLRYEVGQNYGQHTDFWNPKFYTDPDMYNSIHGGWLNRLITVFWYMSSCECGYTSFPDTPTQRLLLSPSLTNTSKLDDPNCPHAFKVTPVPGQAIMFYSLLPDGSGDELSSHEACPVTAGTKWAANKWVWNQAKDFLE
mmetsp:Transcript_37086/g.37763  ORF Transcript_37086/g.37763 Transcript_37086/m.37763 type:complete len:571 (+) Transcript_37086:102-1814(+)|eukprot:CAMPEP_0182429032 /NCGR_PEP_ID=MMETSP1167-20130531/25461_1 /TAXON_ID=2988 /ORGANISM="Mallomonas Sp, Strain CCMP3275" /LENGTH=570 /DNA_ID=CAMNT_0024612329 /DNA_START=101 /DNA_END=1813 /DNA_ORIENTATION=-